MTAYSLLPGKRASYAVHQKPGDRHHVIQDVISLFTETSSSENPSPEPRALVRAKTSEYQGEAMPQTRRNGSASGQEAPTDEPVPLADALDPALAELLAAAAGAQRPREGEEPVHARDAPACVCVCVLLAK